MQAISNINNLKLLVKAGVKQLHLFEHQQFSYYEAYLKGDETPDELEQLVSTNMKLVSIHLPSTVLYKKQTIPIDFCKEGIVEQASFEKLNQLICFSDKNGVDFIVIHLGFYNSMTENRDDILDVVAKKLSQLSPRNVKLCIENVPNWGTFSFEHEPIISDEKHFSYLKERCPKIGAVFDVDHLAINTVFNHFYPGFKQKYTSTQQAPLMEREIYEETNRKPSFFNRMIEQNIKSFLSSIQPDLVHAVGSDFCNYKFIDKLPLVGEALPLGFNGYIKGHEVKDRLNHLLWLSLVRDTGQKEVNVVLELHLREDYDYLTEINNSRRFLNYLV